MRTTTLPESIACASTGPRIPRWFAVSLLCLIVCLAGALRLWHLDQNGYGRLYYAAGVRSMLESPHLFFYNAFDPGGYVSVDKPPIALWMQVAFAKLLGFSAFSLMLTQVVEGLASILLTYWIVARRFGQMAGLVAAIFLAVTPVSVAVDRSNNTESCLTVVMLLAAWALIRASERCSPRMLFVSMALAGIGFNVKMGAALVLVPTFLMVYLLGATDISLRRRLVHLAISLAILATVSLSWIAAFDLTAPAGRPYAGSTKGNSMLELAFEHNGLNRFLDRRGKDLPEPQQSPVGDKLRSSDSITEAPATQNAFPWDQSPPGLQRLFRPFHSAQFNWWLPLALCGVISAIVPWRRARRLAAGQITILTWTGWFVSYMLVFSFAAGVFHTYYIAILAPALAALAGIGSAATWRVGRSESSRAGLAIVFLLSAAWQAYISFDFVKWPISDWYGTLCLASIAGQILVGLILWALPRRMIYGTVQGTLAGLGLFALTALPASWALSTVLVRPNVAVPVANIAAFDVAVDEASRIEARDLARANTRKLIGYLKTNRRMERFLVAVPNSFVAAPLILRSGEPVMAMGGYLGQDPILSPEALESLVRSGELRFVIVGGPRLTKSKTTGELAFENWVVAHGRPVDRKLWRADRDAAAQDRHTEGVNPMQLYDLGDLAPPD